MTFAERCVRVRDEHGLFLVLLVFFLLMGLLGGVLLKRLDELRNPPPPESQIWDRLEDPAPAWVAGQSQSWDRSRIWDRGVS